MDPFTLAMFGSLLLSAFQGQQTYEMQEKALHEQKKAKASAIKEQKEAENKAETQRLEALANNQTVTDYGSIWGVKGSNFADAAQKLSAGTGSFDTDEDETNPFYTRGLF